MEGGKNPCSTQAPITAFVTSSATTIRLHRASAAMQRQLDLVIRLMEADIAVSSPSQLNADKQVQWREMILARAAPVTWNNYRRHVQVLLRYGVTKKLIADNPWEVSSEPVEEVLPKTVSIDRLHDIIASLAREDSRIDPPWFWMTVLRTLYMTGIRRRQLLGLTWADLDFQAQQITLRSKTSKTRREWSVPMMPAVSEALRGLEVRTRAVTGEGYFAEGQVFNVTLFPASSAQAGTQADERMASRQLLPRAPEAPRLQGQPAQGSAYVRNRAGQNRPHQDPSAHPGSSRCAHHFLLCPPGHGRDARSGLESRRQEGSVPGY